MKTQSRAAVLRIIKKEMPYLRKKYGVEQVALFGSYAHQESTENSDIDIVISLSKPLGFTFIELADYLEGKLGRKVDLITKSTLELEILDPRRAHIAKKIFRSRRSMSKIRRDHDYLRDIHDAIGRILEYTAG